MKKLFFPVCACAILAGCASGITTIGDDTYYMSDTGAWSWSSAGNLRAGMMKEAAEFCAKQGKHLQLVSSGGNNASMSQFAHAELMFRCLDKADDDYHRPNAKFTPSTRGAQNY